MKRSIVILAALLLMSAGSAAAGTPVQSPSPAPVPPPVQNPLPPNFKNGPPPSPPSSPFLEKRHAPAIEKVSPGIFRIGDILINKKERSISFPAMVNMEKGLLEYLLVREGGKTHESLLRTAVDPYSLQIAFLLLGYEGTDRPLARQGDPDTPRGEVVGLTVTRAGTGGTAETVDYERWICRKIDREACEVPRLEWVYTGSVVRDGRFLAQLEGSVIALYHDPAALIDTTTKGGESDRIWFVKEGAVPAVGTPITVTIRPKK